MDETPSPIKEPDSQPQLSTLPHLGRCAQFQGVLDWNDAAFAFIPQMGPGTEVDYTEKEYGGGNFVLCFLFVDHSDLFLFSFVSFYPWLLHLSVFFLFFSFFVLCFLVIWVLLFLWFFFFYNLLILNHTTGGLNLFGARKEKQI